MKARLQVGNIVANLMFTFLCFRCGISFFSASTPSLFDSLLLLSPLRTTLGTSKATEPASPSAKSTGAEVPPLVTPNAGGRGAEDSDKVAEATRHGNEVLLGRLAIRTAQSNQHAPATRAAAALVTARDAPAGDSTDKCRGSTRADELNCLTKLAIEQFAHQRKIAFLKTHKTGSTTLATILFRYGVRHCSNVYNGVGHYWRGQLDNSIPYVDIYNRHSNLSFYEFEERLNALFDTNPREDPLFFFSIFRKPVSQYISYFNYFISPFNPVDLNTYVFSEEPISNPLCTRDLKINATSQQEIDQWIETGLPRLNMSLLTHRFDEGLVLLGEALGLSAIDLSYLPLNVGGQGKLNWKRMPVGQFKMSELSNETLARIRNLTVCDQKVYTAIKNRYWDQLAATRERLGQAEFKRRRKELSRVQSLLATQCARRRRSAACKWYAMSDSATERDASRGYPISCERKRQYHLPGGAEGTDLLKYPTGCEVACGFPGGSDCTEALARTNNWTCATAPLASSPRELSL